MTDVNITKVSNTVTVTEADNAVTVTAPGPQGAQGTQGATGPTGPTGPAGEGVPTGGTTGQILAKASATNYDTEWTSSAGRSLALTVWEPSSNADRSNSTTTYQPIRPQGELQTTFTVPPSGRVLVIARITFYSIGNYGLVQMYDGTSLIGNELRLWATGQVLLFNLDGLTAGQSVTIDPYFMRTVSGTVTARVGPFDAAFVNVIEQ